MNEVMYWRYANQDDPLFLPRWLCAMIGMFVVGLSVICVSTKLDYHQVMDDVLHTLYKKNPANYF